MGGVHRSRPTAVETAALGARLADVPTPSAPIDPQPDDRDPMDELDSFDQRDPLDEPPVPSELLGSVDDSLDESSALTLDDSGDGVRSATPARTVDPLAGLERVGAAMPMARPRRRVDVKLLLASFGIAIGLVVMVLGFLRSVTGREQQGLPDAIESIDPIRDATQMPQQTRVFVDLVTGYEAVMVIDGLELEVFSLDGEVGQKPPGLGEGGGEQVVMPPGAIYEPGNNTLTFTPGESQPIESFSTGLHTVTIRYWRTEDGPGRFRTFTWNFYAV